MIVVEFEVSSCRSITKLVGVLLFVSFFTPSPRKGARPRAGSGAVSK